MWVWITVGIFGEGTLDCCFHMPSSSDHAFTFWIFCWTLCFYELNNSCKRKQIMNNTSEFKRFLYFLVTHQVNMDVMYHDLPMKILPSKYNDDVDYVTEYMYFTLNLF